LIVTWTISGASAWAGLFTFETPDEQITIEYFGNINYISRAEASSTRDDNSVDSVTLGTVTASASNIETPSSHASALASNEIVFRAFASASSSIDISDNAIRVSTARGFASAEGGEVIVWICASRTWPQILLWVGFLSTVT
jgi:hypothetical protein